MPNIPTTAIRKCFFIACIVGLTATAASIGHAEKAVSPIGEAGTAARQAQPQMGPAAGDDVTHWIGGHGSRYIVHMSAAGTVRRGS